MKGARVREQAIANDCFVETEMEKRRFENVTMVFFFRRCYFFLFMFFSLQWRRIRTKEDLRCFILMGAAFFAENAFEYISNRFAL